MSKKDLWQTIIKILIYALSSFAGAFSATSCSLNFSVDSESNATASVNVPCETVAKTDTIEVWE